MDFLTVNGAPTPTIYPIISMSCVCFIVLRLSSSSRSHHLLGTQALGATFAVELPSWWLRGGILMKGNREIGKLVFVQMIAEAFLFYIFYYLLIFGCW